MRPLGRKIITGDQTLIFEWHAQAFRAGVFGQLCAIPADPYSRRALLGVPASLLLASSKAVNDYPSEWSRSHATTSVKAFKLPQPVQYNP